MITLTEHELRQTIKECFISGACGWLSQHILKMNGNESREVSLNVLNILGNYRKN